MFTEVMANLPLSFWIEDEREFGEHKARQEVLLAEGDRQFKHGGHSLVLHHAGEGRALQA